VTAAAVLACAACSVGDADTAPTTTSSSSRLAPSQVTADTVPPPPVPDPCDPADLAWWTAAVDADDDGEPASVSAIIRVENRGDVWCEVDISGSPQFAPEVEPDVWLAPGDLARLSFGADGTDCTDRQVATAALIRIDETVVEVPTLAAGECLGFIAFYPDTAPTEQCDADHLRATLTPDQRFVVVGTTKNCQLGALASVDVAGSPLGIIDGDGGAVPVAVEALLVGDLVAFPIAMDDDCQRVPATMTFTTTRTTAATVATADVIDAVAVPVELPGCAMVELGAAHPYFGDDRTDWREALSGAPVEQLLPDWG
jgi:hypothetical protein